MSKEHKIFISHSWTYSPDQYKKLIEWFNQDPYFFYKNYSVPKDDPVHTNGTDKQLYEAIKNQIIGCSVVLIFTGVYNTYSKWINKELQISKEVYNKPIIGINTWGVDRTSTTVKNYADEIVGWNSKSVIEAIKRHSL